MTSNSQDAPASALEESQEAPEAIETETPVSVELEEQTEAPETTNEEVTGREALVAPDLSDLPDDIADEDRKSVV